ncbi:hypothetical protein JCM15831A_22710 [Asaia astilbis]
MVQTNFVIRITNCRYSRNHMILLILTYYFDPSDHLIHPLSSGQSYDKFNESHHQQ